MAVVALLSGCLGADEEARPARGPARDIANVVERLERATAQRDFATICDELFTGAARERAGGDDCERLTRSAAEGIARPRIALKAIRIEGERARAEITTHATGQAEVPDVLELRRERGEWRVEALAD
jgi:molybdopterin synthase catalytic subunit